jgi:RNA polymerase sigma factor (sigma-70 family)
MDPLLQEQRTVPPDEPRSAAARFDPTDAELYERLAPELIHFATTLVGPSGAEDLLATGVLNALTSPRWPAIDNKRAYLYRCLVNEAHKQRRSTSRRLEREVRSARRTVDDPGDRGRGAGPGVLDPTILDALRQLTVRQRAVIYLTYWSDLTPKQVGTALDSSLRTVERDLTNARTRLEELLS